MSYVYQVQIRNEPALTKYYMTVEFCLSLIHVVVCICTDTVLTVIVVVPLDVRRLSGRKVRWIHYARLLI